MAEFKLVSDFKPKGDQPQAIEALCKGLDEGKAHQVLLGVTGSGKTFTMANVIAHYGRPTLVISHNKTLAAQLYSEFKEFFPYSAVNYFVSYYDYYQPEAYIPQKDIYIEKDASINEDIDRLRLAATSSLMSREDVIIVASVSCIYGLGSPSDYKEMMVHLKKGASYERDDVLRKLVEIQYDRNDVDFSRGKVPRIILDAAAVTHLLQHLHIISRAGFKALGLKKLALAAKFLKTFLKLDPNGLKGRPERAIGKDEMFCRIDKIFIKGDKDFAGERMYLINALQLIAEKLEAQCKLLIRRVHLDHV
ncbi:unnamed protein product, partial [marine sediment metagenome]